MAETGRLSHPKWVCKYHVVFIAKCRRRTLYEQLRQPLGEVLRRLAAQKESRIEEGHLMSDHVHLMIAIPPKYAVSQVIGYIKGKECDVLGSGIRRGQEKLCRAAIVGERLLWLDGGPGRGVDSGIHQAPGS